MLKFASVLPAQTQTHHCDSRQQRMSTRWWIVGALILSALVYAPAIGFGFAYDDGWVLVSNGFLRTPELRAFWDPSPRHLHVPDLFRPTSVGLDILMYQLCGLRPAIHHAFSVALHLGTTFLLYRQFRRISAPDPQTAELRAAAGAALFGVMAIHAEAVTIISFREDLLAATFGLLALEFIDRINEHRSTIYKLACLLLGTMTFALACGAKLSVAPLPLALVLLRCNAIPRLGSWLPQALALGAGLGLSLWQDLCVLGSLNPYLAQSQHPRVAWSHARRIDVLISSLEIHGHYLQRMLWPSDLAAEYPRPELGSHALELGLAIGLAAVALLIANRRHPAAVCSIVRSVAAWLVLAIPTSLVFAPLLHLEADRYAYLASAPIAWLLGLAMLGLGERLTAHVPTSSKSTVRYSCIAAAVCMQGAVAITTSRTYAHDGSIWYQAAKRAPNAARPAAMLGILKLHAGHDRVDLDPELVLQVQAHCENAIALEPEHYLGWLCAARLAASQKHWSEAASNYARVLELQPVQLGRWQSAMAQVLRQLPDSPEDPFNAKKIDRLLGHALAQSPFEPELWLAAADAAQRQGDPRRALSHLEIAWKLYPERWETTFQAIELALDRGDVAAAGHTWRSRRTLRQRAGDIHRESMAKRVRDAELLRAAHPIDEFFDAGVFPNEPPNEP